MSLAPCVVEGYAHLSVLTQLLLLSVNLAPCSSVNLSACLQIMTGLKHPNHLRCASASYILDLIS